MSAWFPASQPLLLAHRGASAHAPENTLAAFRLALEQGADGVELDAKLTADGRVIVIHDPNTLRTTGVPAEIKEKSLADLRALDAGSFFAAEFAGELIPTLEEVFAEFGGRCLIDIELTNYHNPFDGLAGRVVDLVRRHGLQGSVLFTSFLPSNLQQVRRLLPQVPAGLLGLTGLPGRIAAGPLGRMFAPDLVLPHYTSLYEGIIHAQHRRGRQIITWTVNDTETARRLLAAGVNGIITDDPLLMRAVFDGGGEGET